MDNRLIFRYPLWSARAEPGDAKPVLLFRGAFGCPGGGVGGPIRS